MAPEDDALAALSAVGDSSNEDSEWDEGQLAQALAAVRLAHSTLAVTPTQRPQLQSLAMVPLRGNGRINSVETCAAPNVAVNDRVLADATNLFCEHGEPHVVDLVPHKKAGRAAAHQALPQAVGLGL